MTDTMQTDGSATESTAPTMCNSVADCGEGEECLDGICSLDPGGCGSLAFKLPAITPNVLLVLDKSGSMVEKSWDADPNTPDVTRWFAVHQSVSALIAGFDTSLDLGLVLFPSPQATSEYNEMACLVDAAPQVACTPQGGAKILDVLPPALATSVQIAGATPARSAVQVARHHLEEFDDQRPRAIILVTDGAANCAPEAPNNMALFENYDDLLVDEVADAFGSGIPVFVIGIDIANETSDAMQDGSPDSVNVYQKLNEVALAGGRPKDDPSEKFYQTSNQFDILAAVTSIAGQLLSCEVHLGSTPSDPDRVEITVDDQTYMRTPGVECDFDDGWIYTSPEYDRVELCGDACVRLKSVGFVDVAFGCPQ